MTKILVCLLIFLTGNFPAYSQEIKIGCSVNTKSLLTNAAMQGIKREQEILFRNIPKRIRDVSCLKNIFDIDVDFLISVPNIAKILSESLARGCKAAKTVIDKSINQSIKFNGPNLSLPDGQVISTGRVEVNVKSNSKAISKEESYNYFKKLFGVEKKEKNK